MDGHATVDQAAMGFAGLASLVSTIPDPAPAMVKTPGARRAARSPWVGLIGVGIFVVARFLTLMTHPNAPTSLQIPQNFAPQTFPPMNLTPQNLVSPTPASPRFAMPGFAPQTFAPAAPPQAGSAPAPLPWPSTISEVKPPPGTELTLSSPQILYCLAQKVRLDTMEPIVDRTSTAQVGAFNALVGDYDQRCLSYHYRRADMEAAERLVALTRGILAKEARTQVAAWH